MDINLSLSSEVLTRVLKNPKIKDFEKAKLVMPLIVKTIPTKVEGDIKVSGICVEFSDGTKIQM